ncbi:gephyrin-like molybdotransferase receptor GlpR [Kitasatospora sp. NPDC008050]|uniref:divisome protein SepX/GlpR n=1 Tax=Kitasatospora sp. NPDC008050 TaxID=3364021 RepID=UPI0036EADD41
MSSSGLIYAVIVGAWAAYLVPMWLRRQDELNEARPTERFSTAIRLLAGRSGLERRASRALGDNDPSTTSDSDDGGDANHRAGAGASDARSGGADPAGATDGMSAPSAGSALSAAAMASAIAGASAAGDRRARLLARRRRMVTVLFLAFALGAITAAVAGVDFLWAPALPALLLTLYIGHLRRLERQRYEVKLDRSRAAQAAQRVREREQARLAATVALAPPAEALAPEPERGRPDLRVAAAPPEPRGARQALVEATDHQEWVDGLRERAAAGPDSWEPVPVPLPTYVTAPVAPRVSRGLDLGAPGTWSSGRPVEQAHTPLFDQYETSLPAAPQPDEHYATRPRAANE